MGEPGPANPASATRLKRDTAADQTAAGLGRRPFPGTGHKRTPVSAFIRDRRACVRSTASLLDALRHLGHAHQWPGELVEKLIGVLLFAQGELQQLHDRR